MPKNSEQKNVTANIKKKFGVESLDPKFDWKQCRLFVPLLQHQSQAVKAIEKHREKWGKFDNGVIVDMATGYGKTVLGLEQICIHLRNYNPNINPGILILCSSSDLRVQWAEEIRDKTNIPCGSSVFLWTEVKEFPNIPTNQPFIVITTYRVLMLADTKNHNQVFQKDLWSFIILDEGHTYRNYMTMTALALMRLCRGKKAKPELKKRLKKIKQQVETPNLQDRQPRKRFSDMFEDMSNEGSKNSFKMILSGTIIVNWIVDILIQAMIIGKRMYNCLKHKEDHFFDDEKYWRTNLFVLSKDKDSLSPDVYNRAIEIYREFSQEFFISFEEDQIVKLLNLPEKYVIPIPLEFIPKSKQEKSYNCVAHTFEALFENLESLIEENKKSNVKKISEIHSQIVVCVQFLTMLVDHPACIKAELTRVKGKELPKYVQYLLEAYAQHGFEMSYKEPTVKVDAIIAIIRKIQQEYPGDKILIFSSYRSFIDILYWHLQKHFGKDILARYTGGMSRNRKAIELDRFKNGNAKILLSVFRTGGLGLNLTEANHVINCESPYTFAEWRQAVTRAYRIMQTKTVFIYDLLIQNSIDFYRLIKNTKKYGDLKEFKKNPSGYFQARITHQDTKDLYELIVNNDPKSKLDEQTLAMIREKEEQIMKIHVEKLSSIYEKKMEYNEGEEIEDEEDDLEFVFSEDEDSDREEDQPPTNEIEKAVKDIDMEWVGSNDCNDSKQVITEEENEEVLIKDFIPKPMAKKPKLFAF